MKIRVVFGCLFFMLGVLFSAIQMTQLSFGGHLEGLLVFLQFIIAAACLALGSLAIEGSHRPTNAVLSVAAFAGCCLFLLAAGLTALQRAGEATFIKCLLFLTYAGLYGVLGFAFSCRRAGKLTPPRRWHRLPENPLRYVDQQRKQWHGGAELRESAEDKAERLMAEALRNKGAAEPQLKTWRKGHPFKVNWQPGCERKPQSASPG